MATVAIDPLELHGDVFELRYEPRAPVALADLAASFAALDSFYRMSVKDGSRLSVAQLRSGSIIALLQPILPILGQVIPILEASLTVSDFTGRLKSAIDAFADIGTSDKGEQASPNIARELGEILRPVAGKPGSELAISHVKYRSETKDRVVELEAIYNSSEIDRASINATKAALSDERPIDRVEESAAPSLLRKVKLTLKQANSGPAKTRGNTGDRGIISSETDKPLPVYFADGLDRLKDKIVGGSKNPLTASYIVDVLVSREGRAARAYTVIEVHSLARKAREKALPLLASPKRAGRPKA